MREIEIAWNQVIWQAMRNLKNYACIDEVFSVCEKDLYALKASKKETELRLFALALYCDKAHNLDFFKSLAFSRFGAALDFFRFKRIATSLITENNFALVVFWVIFRLSFKNSIPKSSYLQLETKMKKKSFELGTNFVY